MVRLRNDQIPHRLVSLPCRF